MRAASASESASVSASASASASTPASTPARSRQGRRRAPSRSRAPSRDGARAWTNEPRTSLCIKTRKRCIVSRDMNSNESQNSRQMEVAGTTCTRCVGLQESTILGVWREDRPVPLLENIESLLQLPRAAPRGGVCVLSGRTSPPQLVGCCVYPANALVVVAGWRCADDDRLNHSTLRAVALVVARCKWRSAPRPTTRRPGRQLACHQR